MKKILLITSQTTFVPENYHGLFKTLVENFNKNDETKKQYKIIVVFLKNAHPKLIFKAIALILGGAPRIGFHLMKNYFQSIFLDPRKDFLKKNNIMFYEFQTPNSVKFRNFLRLEKIDVIINARTRFIYKKKTLLTPKFGCFNVHHGLLPENRGTMCDLWALFKDKEMGHTLHQMNEKIDDGLIIDTVSLSQNEKFKSIIANKNYVQYIQESSFYEGQTIYNFITEKLPLIEKQGVEAISKKNISKNYIYYKNPKLKEIIEMRKKGLKL